MRIYVVSPTHYDASGALHKTTRYWTSALTLPYLKAITPKGHDVEFVDELMHDVDLREHQRGKPSRRPQGLQPGAPLPAWSLPARERVA